MDFINLMITGAIISILGAMSPGPDTMVVTRNSLYRCHRSGILTAVGISLATCIHISYCLLGVAWLLNQSKSMFIIMKCIGAAYLFYLGLKTIIDKQQFVFLTNHSVKQKEHYFLSFREGFLTNLFNPNMTLFFLAIFSGLIQFRLPLEKQTCFVLLFIVLPFVWYSMLSVFFSYSKIRALFIKLERFLPAILGVIIIGFGVMLLVSSKG